MFVHCDSDRREESCIPFLSPYSLSSRASPGVIDGLSPLGYGPIPPDPLSEGKRGERHFVYATAKLWCETLLRTDY